MHVLHVHIYDILYLIIINIFYIYMYADVHAKVAIEVYIVASPCCTFDIVGCCLAAFVYLLATNHWLEECG